MTAPVRPAFYVEPPTVEPYEFGLFGAAQPLGLDDPHWLIGGIEWESLAAYPASFYAAGLPYSQDPVPAAATKSWEDSLGVSTAWPFGVYAGVKCGTFGHSRDYVAQRANTILDLAGQHAAEQALWGGTGDPAVTSLTSDVPGSPGTHLATTLTAGAVPVVEAVALCEKWLADNYNGRGMLHAPRDVSAYASDRRLVKHRQPSQPGPEQLVTPLGTRWVFGGGYDGSGPGGVAPTAGSEWIFVTGQVVIVRGPEFAPATFEQAISRIDNQEYYIAEQGYLLGIDGPWAAAQVTTTGA